MKEKSKIGIIVGRFQTPYLHVGHLHIIATAIRECDEVLILLGSQEEKDDRNPYDITTRQNIIQKIFPQVDIIVLWDIPGNDFEWSVNIDTIIDNYCGDDTPILYHSRDSFIEHYHGRFKNIKQVDEIEGYSATKIREIIKN